MSGILLTYCCVTSYFIPQQHRTHLSSDSSCESEIQVKLNWEPLPHQPAIRCQARLQFHLRVQLGNDPLLTVELNCSWQDSALRAVGLGASVPFCQLETTLSCHMGLSNMAAYLSKPVREKKARKTKVIVFCNISSMLSCSIDQKQTAQGERIKQGHKYQKPGITGGCLRGYLPQLSLSLSFCCMLCSSSLFCFFIPLFLLIFLFQLIFFFFSIAFHYCFYSVLLTMLFFSWCLLNLF